MFTPKIISKFYKIQMLICDKYLPSSYKYDCYAYIVRKKDTYLLQNTKKWWRFLWISSHDKTSLTEQVLWKQLTLTLKTARSEKLTDIHEDCKTNQESRSIIFLALLCWRTNVNLIEQVWCTARRFYFAKFGISPSWSN